MTRHPALPERDRRILGVLVQAYIDAGEPVSSLWLASRGFGVSSATLRNVLVRLEDYGYVRQPHTSAGRVPTDLGYRAYVDQLMSERRASRPAPRVEARLRQAGTVDDLLSHVSHEVSRAAHHVGFAISPSTDTARLEHLEFVPLDSERILVVVVSDGGQISHKVITPARRYEPVELQQAANFLNTEFRGCSLGDIRQMVLERVRDERALYDALMERALLLASSTFDEVDAAPVVFIQGTSFLIEEMVGGDPEETLQTLRTLLKMIEEKARLVQLLDEYLSGAALTVVIGSEHAAPDLRSFSIVAASYNDGRRSGAVGVIGPTRMRYSRAIDAVDSLTRAMNRLVGRTDAQTS